jgi:Ca2+-binding RTX toxin-like protein
MTPAPRHLLAAGLLAAAVLLTADAADASYSVAIKKRTLTITGNGAGERLALRARPRKLEIDVGDNGTADFLPRRRRFDRIRVRAGAGNDRVRIDESRIVFTKQTRTTLEGGRGADTLLGGRGGERLIAGDGNDLVDGRRGNDTGRLGPGDDRFSWDAGDGSDTIDGATGRDTLTLDGSRADEAFRLSPNLLRARLVGDVGGVALDLGTLEQVDVRALAGADALTIDDLAGTTLQAVTADLGDADAATDRAIVNGSQFDDTIDVAGANGGATVAGVSAPLMLTGAEPGRDQLIVNALAGFDRVSSAGLAATTLALTADGGAEDDALAGGPAGETFIGGDGNDAADGNQGDDRALLGAGDDRFTWDPGDGSDTVEGHDGIDTMAFNGSGAAESFATSANGARVRFTRDVGNIAMDLDGVERVDTAAAGGGDRMQANDVSGTDLTALRFALGIDGAPDELTVGGSNGADSVTATGAAGAATLTGLPGGLMVSLLGAQAPDRLIVSALGGDDTVDAAALSANAVRLTVDGGVGGDTVRGGRGPDVLLAGDGNDAADGNQGDDVAFLGAGDDRFVWEAGDGSDTLEGQAGVDATHFEGSAMAESFDVSANGGRVRFSRDLGSITMDLDDFERIATAALGGAARFAADDLTGTDLTALDVALGSDGADDDVMATGTGGNDVARVTGGAGTATLTGLPAALTVTGAEAPGDRLSVRLMAGDDAIDASGLAADGVGFRSEGGDGADTLIGSAGPDMLRGDAGDDRLRGGPGADDLDGGAGNNTVVQD